MFECVRLNRQHHIADRMNAHRQNPSGHQHREMTKTRRSETILKTNLVNLKRIGHIPLAHGVPPFSAFFRLTDMAGTPLFLNQSTRLFLYHSGKMAKL